MKAVLIFCFFILIVGCHKNPNPIEIQNVKCIYINSKRMSKENAVDFINRWNSADKDSGYRLYLPDYYITIYLKSGKIIEMATSDNLVNMSNSGDELSYPIGNKSYFKNVYNNSK